METSQNFSYQSRREHERGNILFIILLAVVLIGLLTAAIQATNNSESSNIDDETLVIRASDVQRAAAEIERGVKYIMQNGKSETELSFAHPSAPSDYGTIGTNPETEVFNPDGGAATYPAVASDINDGSPWEFYAGTALPGIGTSKADLVAVLPNVTAQFCEKINALNGQSGQPADTGASAAAGATGAGDCIMMGDVGRFGDGVGDQYYSTPNTVDATTFEQDPSISAARPAAQACVQCAIGPAYHFYHVLLAR
jgi:hypothetical protein